MSDTPAAPVDDAPNPGHPNPNPYASPTGPTALVDPTTASAESAPSSSGRPGYVRFGVMAFICGLAAILYLDRVCMSKALKSIGLELGLDNNRLGDMHLAFMLAYGLFEVPAGRWGDQIGSRKVVTRICLWWSLFTALTGACFGYWSMLIVRFLFGAGEAGAFPNAARIMARWFPEHERGRVQGFVLTASHCGSVVAPIGAAALIETIGWRWTFAAFGAIGAVWSVAFFWWFRDNPAEHESVGQAERDYIAAGAKVQEPSHEIPWSAVANNPAIWLLCATMCLASFNSYLYFSWYAKYLEDGRGVTNMNAGWMTSMVMAGAAVGTILGGVLVDRFLARRDVFWWRAYAGTCYVAAAVLTALSARSENVWVSAGFCALSFGVTQSVQPMWWTVMTRVAGRNIGALFGLCNMCGMFGGLTSLKLVPWLTEIRLAAGKTGRDAWDPTFNWFVVVLLVASLCWYAMSLKPVEDEDHAPPKPAHA